jgi:hypothetical protein
MGTARDDLRHEKRISLYEGFSWVIEDEIPKHAGCFATPYITTDAEPPPRTTWTTCRPAEGRQ